MIEITLRDYFAAKAMQAIVEKHQRLSGDRDDPKLKMFRQEVAAGAYAIADAMLAERKEKS